ncbi:hypothetical protein [Streptomyces sp. NPDC059861]|uniref:hypothetical protein n=1 Tax=Streptomyces sp. NPDC059861 TaxID=3346974 RepID=UPI00364AEC39
MRLLELRKFCVVIAAALSTVILTSGSASAYPWWQDWTPVQGQECSATTHHEVSTKVLFQTCIVPHPTNGTAQPVLIVRNNATVTVGLENAKVSSLWSNKTYGCALMYLAPGRVAACYGGTTSLVLGNNQAVGQFTYNGITDNTAFAEFPYAP